MDIHLRLSYIWQNHQIPFLLGPINVLILISFSELNHPVPGITYYGRQAIVFRNAAEFIQLICCLGCFSSIFIGENLFVLFY